MLLHDTCQPSQVASCITLLYVIAMWVWEHCAYCTLNTCWLLGSLPFLHADIFLSSSLSSSLSSLPTIFCHYPTLPPYFLHHFHNHCCHKSLMQIAWMGCKFTKLRWHWPWKELRMSPDMNWRHPFHSSFKVQLCLTSSMMFERRSIQNFKKQSCMCSLLLGSCGSTRLHPGTEGWKRTDV